MEIEPQLTTIANNTLNIAYIVRVKWNAKERYSVPNGGGIELVYGARIYTVDGGAIFVSDKKEITKLQKLLSVYVI